MPSTNDHKTLSENVVLNLDNKSLWIDVYDTPLGGRWIDALKDNLIKKRVLEKKLTIDNR